MATLPEEPAIVAATSLEARAVRRHAPQAHVVESGIGLARLRASALGRCAISCGLAGGLRTDLPTGTVLIPSSISTTDGVTVDCDPDWTLRLLRSRRRAAAHQRDADQRRRSRRVGGARLRRRRHGERADPGGVACGRSRDPRHASERTFQCLAASGPRDPQSAQLGRGHVAFT